MIDGIQSLYTIIELMTYSILRTSWKQKSVDGITSAVRKGMWRNVRVGSLFRVDLCWSILEWNTGPNNESTRPTVFYFMFWGDKEIFNQLSNMSISSEGFAVELVDIHICALTACWRGRNCKAECDTVRKSTVTCLHFGLSTKRFFNPNDFFGKGNKVFGWRTPKRAQLIHVPHMMCCKCMHDYTHAKTESIKYFCFQKLKTSGI